MSLAKKHRLVRTASKTLPTQCTAGGEGSYLDAVLTVHEPSRPPSVRKPSTLLTVPNSIRRASTRMRGQRPRSRDGAAGPAMQPPPVQPTAPSPGVRRPGSMDVQQTAPPQAVRRPSSLDYGRLLKPLSSGRPSQPPPLLAAAGRTVSAKLRRSLSPPAADSSAVAHAAPVGSSSVAAQRLRLTPLSESPRMQPAISKPQQQQQSGSPRRCTSADGSRQLVHNSLYPARVGRCAARWKCSRLHWTFERGLRENT